MIYEFDLAINYCIFNSKKTIVEYDIKLNEEQKKEIKERR